MKKAAALILCLLLLLTATPVWAQEAEDKDSPLIWMQTLSIAYPDGKEFATAGDTVRISVYATDNVGIADFWFELASPDGTHNIVENMHSAGDDLYYYDFTVDGDTDAGYWNLARMKLTDTSGHSMYIYDLDTYHIGVHGSIDEGDISLSGGESYIYSPDGVRPAVTVIHKGITLKNGTDYKLTYRNNKNVGTASVTVTGIGCFEGASEKSFRITPQTKFTAKLSCDTYYYTKEVKTPKVTVYDGKHKVPPSAYTLTYPKGRKTVGTYAVKVKMQGNYSGSKTLYFTINPKNTKITRITRQKKGFTLQWKKHKPQTKAYQIQYSTNLNFKNAKTITIKNLNTTKKTVKNLKSKKRYYIRIRCTNGKHHSKWSKTISIVTK